MYDSPLMIKSKGLRDFVFTLSTCESKCFFNGTDPPLYISNSKSALSERVPTRSLKSPP